MSEEHHSKLLRMMVELQAVSAIRYDLSIKGYSAVTEKQWSQTSDWLDRTKRRLVESLLDDDTIRAFKRRAVTKVKREAKAKGINLSWFRDPNEPPKAVPKKAAKRKGRSK